MEERWDKAYHEALERECRKRKAKSAIKPIITLGAVALAILLAIYYALVCLP